MTHNTDYVPPRVWTWDQPSGGEFANINRPIAGATHDKALPVGKHPFQLYSLATPNGQKASILFEELLEKGHRGAEYDAWPIRIGEGDQFGSGFVAINPNSKIPALVDHSGPEPVRVFESGAILLYLAGKTGRFIPADPRTRMQCIEWLFWQMASLGPMTGQYGHFHTYAPEKIPYAMERYRNEAERLLGVLNTRLRGREFIVGDEYSIADMACYPWISPYSKAPLDLTPFPDVQRWHAAIAQRPATQRAYERGASLRREGPMTDEEKKILFGQRAR